jgi:hypothetical protein
MLKTLVLLKGMALAMPPVLCCIAALAAEVRFLATGDQIPSLAKQTAEK